MQFGVAVQRHFSVGRRHKMPFQFSQHGPTPSNTITSTRPALLHTYQQHWPADAPARAHHPKSPSFCCFTR